MTYQEASKIGSKIEGYIKCTFMEIFSTDNDKLFSLQRSYKKPELDYYTPGGGVGAADMWLSFSLPVCRMDQYADSKYKGKVFVHLTDEIREYIYFMVDHALSNADRNHKQQYKQLKKIVEQNEVVLVKEVAVEWIPADYEKVITESGLSLDEAIEQAAEELRQAKIMLGAAGAAAVVL